MEMSSIWHFMNLLLARSEPHTSDYIINIYVIWGEAGHNQVHQRPHRAHPLESADKPGTECGGPGESKETFLSDAGVYQVEGV